MPGTLETKQTRRNEKEVKIKLAKKTSPLKGKFYEKKFQNFQKNFQLVFKLQTTFSISLATDLDNGRKFPKKLPVSIQATNNIFN